MSLISVLLMAWYLVMVSWGGPCERLTRPAAPITSRTQLEPADPVALDADGPLPDDQGTPRPHPRPDSLFLGEPAEEAEAEAECPVIADWFLGLFPVTASFEDLALKPALPVPIVQSPVLRC
jgi:hypothetical protein